MLSSGVLPEEADDSSYDSHEEKNAENTNVGILLYYNPDTNIRMNICIFCFFRLFRMWIHQI